MSHKEKEREKLSFAPVSSFFSFWASFVEGCFQFPSFKLSNNQLAFLFSIFFTFIKFKTHIVVAFLYFIHDTVTIVIENKFF